MQVGSEASPPQKCNTLNVLEKVSSTHRDGIRYSRYPFEAEVIDGTSADLNMYKPRRKPGQNHCDEGFAVDINIFLALRSKSGVFFYFCVVKVAVGELKQVIG